MNTNFSLLVFGTLVWGIGGFDWAAGWAVFLWFCFSILALALLPGFAVSIPNKGNSWIVLYLLAVLFTVGPILSVLIAGAIASAAGAKLDESGPHPCMIFGSDFGGLLYTMFGAGWFGLVTIPIGLLVTLKIAGEHRKRKAMYNP